MHARDTEVELVLKPLIQGLRAKLRRPSNVSLKNLSTLLHALLNLTPYGAIRMECDSGPLNHARFPKIHCFNTTTRERCVPPETFLKGIVSCIIKGLRGGLNNGEIIEDCKKIISTKKYQYDENRIVSFGTLSVELNRSPNSPAVVDTEPIGKDVHCGGDVYVVKCSYAGMLLRCAYCGEKKWVRAPRRNGECCNIGKWKDYSN